MIDSPPLSLSLIIILYVGLFAVFLSNCVCAYEPVQLHNNLFYKLKSRAAQTAFEDDERKTFFRFISMGLREVWANQHSNSVSLISLQRCCY